MEINRNENVQQFQIFFLVWSIAMQNPREMIATLPARMKTRIEVKVEAERIADDFAFSSSWLTHLKFPRKISSLKVNMKVLFMGTKSNKLLDFHNNFGHFSLPPPKLCCRRKVCVLPHVNLQQNIVHFTNIKKYHRKLDATSKTSLKLFIWSPRTIIYSQSAPETSAC